MPTSHNRHPRQKRRLTGATHAARLQTLQQPADSKPIYIYRVGLRLLLGAGARKSYQILGGKSQAELKDYTNDE